MVVEVRLVRSQMSSGSVKANDRMHYEAVILSSLHLDSACRYHFTHRKAHVRVFWCFARRAKPTYEVALLLPALVSTIGRVTCATSTST